MPELPEVETILRAVQPQLVGQRIATVKVLLPRMIKNLSADTFTERLSGQVIQTVERRGKYLLFCFAADLRLVIHLRMTGRLYYMPSSEPLDRFTRVVFVLENGFHLRYGDIRTLGTLDLVTQAQLCQLHGLHCLGVEPLGDAFTVDYLEHALKKGKRVVKAMLLDQTRLAGLGNIYVDESLAIACIHPERPGASLSRDEIQRLHDAIVRALEEGINHGGTSFRDYRNAQGRPGDHQHYLYVYGRTGQPCRHCGEAIIKKVVAGRGTHFCPHCQLLQ